MSLISQKWISGVIGVVFIIGSTTLLAEEAFLAVPVDVPLVIGGKPSGKASLPVGTRVQVVERRDGKTRVRALVGETWVMENDLTTEYVKTAPPVPQVPQATTGKAWEWVVAPRYEEASPFGVSGFAWVKRQGKWFVINKQGREVFQAPFDHVMGFSEQGSAQGQLGGGKGSKVGLVGPNGKLVLKPEWDDVGDLIRGYVPVKHEGKWGYADESGKLVIPCEWEDAWRFSPVGTAIVVRDGKRGILDTKGKVLVEPVWDGAINHTAEGVGAVRRGEGWALIDKNGKVLCEPEWRIQWALQRFDLGWIPVWKSESDKKIGLLDKNGRLIVPLEWDSLLPAKGGILLTKSDGEGIFIGAGGKTVSTTSLGLNGIPQSHIGFFDGLAMVSVSDGSSGILRGFIDEQGKQAVPFCAGEFLPFSEGFAAHRSEGKWGFIDRNGKPSVPYEWDDVRSFAGKRAAVCRGGKWGFIDNSGKVITPPEWDLTGDYSEGLAAVGKKTDGETQWTFLDPLGAVAFTLDPKFHPRLIDDRPERVTAAPGSSPRFRKGYLVAYSGDTVWLDKTGRMASNFPVSGSEIFLHGMPTPFARRYPEWEGFRQGYDYGGGRQVDLVSRNGQQILSGVSKDIDFTAELIPYPGVPAYGWIDEGSGKIIVPPTYDYVRQLSDRLILVRENGKFGVSSREGKQVLAVEWDSIRMEGEELLLASRGGKDILFTDAGRRIEFPGALTGCEYVDFYGPDFMVRQPDGKYSLCSTKTGDFFTFSNAQKVYWNGNQAKAGFLWIQEATNGKWSLIRRDGTPLGFFEKEKPKYWMHKSRLGLVRDDEGKVFFVDSNGRELGSERWDDAKLFQNGFAAVFRKGEGWGYIGEDGSVRIPLGWDDIKPFEKVVSDSGVILVASVARRQDVNGKPGSLLWGLIDATGKVILEPQSEGRSVDNVRLRKGKGTAYVRKGNRFESIPVDFSGATSTPEPSSENLLSGGEREKIVYEMGMKPIAPDWARMIPAGDGLYLWWTDSDGALTNRQGKCIFRDGREARLVRWNRGPNSQVFKHPVIFIERPPLWGYVKLNVATASSIGR